MARQLGFYVVEFLITFAIIVALNANMEWLRLAVASAHIVTAPVPNVKRAVGRIRTFRYDPGLSTLFFLLIFFLYFVLAGTRDPSTLSTLCFPCFCSLWISRSWRSPPRGCPRSSRAQSA